MALNMIDKKNWQEFRETGLLWFMNSFLHAFGWSIVLNVEAGSVTEAYPARVKFRGFGEADTAAGYRKLSKYMAENAQTLFDESLQ